MKVYIAKSTMAYSGGVVIIAAESLEEAQRIAEEAIFFKNCTEVSESTDLQTTRTESGVIIDSTYIE